MPVDGRVRLEGLQVLRFAAAFLVLFGHLIHEGQTFAFLPAGAEAAFAFLPWEAGVDIFFVISGFIMFFVSADEFGKPGAQGRFLMRRIVRLVPLYWLFTVLMLIAIVLFPGRINVNALDPAQILASFVFLPWMNAEHLIQPVLKLGWTLNYEMFFYALFSVALLFPRRIGIPGLVALFAALASVHVFVPGNMVQMRFWTNPVVLEFAAGMLIAYGFAKGWRLPQRLAIPVIALGGAGLAAAPFLMFDSDFARPLLYGIPAALIVCGTAASGYIARNTAGRGAVLMGDASYALYLSHPFSVNLMALVFGKIALGWLFVPVTLAFAILASVVVHLVLERPLTRWLNARARAHAAAKAESIATGRDPTLDMFRGLAILLVALYHYTARLPHEALNMVGPVPVPVGFGWIGVFFFFVISGYCIFLTLTRSESVRRFFARRISRLYPAFIAAAVGLFVFAMLAPVPSVPAVNFHEQPATLLDLGLNLILLGEAGEWVNGSFWSIATEVRFYVLLALLAAVFGTGERLVRLFSYIAVALASLWVAMTLILPATGSASPTNLLRVFGLAPYLPFFAFGILLFMRRTKAMPTDMGLMLNGAAMVLVLAVDSYNSSYLHPTGAIDALVTISVFAVLMFAFLRFADRRPLPVPPVIGPLLVQAGLVSYSWYLLHEMLGLTLMAALGPHVPPVMNVVTALGATLVMAIVFSWAVEWRFRKPVEALAYRLVSLLPNLPASRRMHGPAE